MNENGKMKDNIGSKVVQANPKIVKKSVKKGRSRKAETRTDKEMKRIISLGLRAGTRCSPGALQSANSLPWIRPSLTSSRN